MKRAIIPLCILIIVIGITQQLTIYKHRKIAEKYKELIVEQGELIKEYKNLFKIIKEKNDTTG